MASETRSTAKFKAVIEAMNKDPLASDTGSLSKRELPRILTSYKQNSYVACDASQLIV